MSLLLTTAQATRLRFIAEAQGYLAATSLAKEHGGLLSHPILDTLLQKLQKESGTLPSEGFTVVRELLVRQTLALPFKKGSDIEKEYDGTWVLPARYFKDVPLDVLSNRSVFIVDPCEIEVNSDKRIIHPRFIFVLDPLPKELGFSSELRNISFYTSTGAPGRVNPQTGIPLGIDENVLKEMPADLVRFIGPSEASGASFFAITRTISSRYWQHLSLIPALESYLFSVWLPEI